MQAMKTQAELNKYFYNDIANIIMFYSFKDYKPTFNLIMDELKELRETWEQAMFEQDLSFAFHHKNGGLIGKVWVKGERSRFSDDDFETMMRILKGVHRNKK